jgi:hypothetical protein
MANFKIDVIKIICSLVLLPGCGSLVMEGMRFWVIGAHEPLPMVEAQGWVKDSETIFIPWEQWKP